jgi:hypothetical protein
MNLNTKYNNYSQQNLKKQAINMNSYKPAQSHISFAANTESAVSLTKKALGGRYKGEWAEKAIEKAEHIETTLSNFGKLAQRVKKQITSALSKDKDIAPDTIRSSRPHKAPVNLDVKRIHVEEESYNIASPKSSEKIMPIEIEEPAPSTLKSTNPLTEERKLLLSVLNQRENQQLSKALSWQNGFDHNNLDHVIEREKLTAHLKEHGTHEQLATHLENCIEQDPDFVNEGITMLTPRSTDRHAKRNAENQGLLLDCYQKIGLTKDNPRILQTLSLIGNQLEVAEKKNIIKHPANKVFAEVQKNLMNSLPAA